MNWKTWLHGLGAAFIGGGAGAVSAGFSASLTDPKDFNLGTGLAHMGVLVGTTFIVSGFMSAMGYLKQSPLPAPVPAPKTP